MKIRNLLLTGTLALLQLASASQLLADSTAFVQVRSFKVRKGPDFVSENVADVKLGDQVTVLGEEDDYLKVRTPNGLQGYLHKSAVTEDNLVLKSRSRSSTVDRGSVALASKGFDNNTEAVYQRDNPAANFAEVNRMERLTVSEGELRAFIAAGGLGRKG
jgi:hypothetical protein